MTSTVHLLQSTSMRTVDACERQTIVQICPPVVGARRPDHDRAWRTASHIGRDAAQQRRTRTAGTENNQTRLVVGGGGDEAVGRVADVHEPERLGPGDRFAFGESSKPLSDRVDLVL